MVQRFLAGGTEDLCQGVTYTYGTNTANFSYNRLLTAQYGSGSTCASYGGITIPSFTENYLQRARQRDQQDRDLQRAGQHTAGFRHVLLRYLWKEHVRSISVLLSIQPDYIHDRL